MPRNDRDEDAGNRPPTFNPDREFGPIVDHGTAHVGVPRAQWLRAMRDLEVERLTTYHLRRTLMTLIPLVDALARGIVHDETRNGLLRVAEMAREAARTRIDR